MRLISDSYWNQGMNLNSNSKRKWLISGKKIFNNDPLFDRTPLNGKPRGVGVITKRNRPVGSNFGGVVEYYKVSIRNSVRE